MRNAISAARAEAEPGIFLKECNGYAYRGRELVERLKVKTEYRHVR